MESIVIGTAGHVDHGKTTLVKALTGKDTDTLEEEKRRGITINLGFAYFTLPCGKVAGIVDVPGHERLIKNMLAGASGIDIAVIVIAATEGVMPQTREHIDILRYMNIRHSVIVLTKADMVDEEFLELVQQDTKEYLSQTFLKDTPIYPVDSLSGRGIPSLISCLDKIAENLEPRNLYGDPRMSVDRVFTVKGFGTVVTGTLSDGTIRVDDELTIYPQGVATKVRSLQIHEQDVREAHAGQRTAINLAGITKEQVVRGSVVAKKNSVSVTSVMDVFLTMTHSTRFTIKRMEEYKLYLGAREQVVKVVPLGRRQIAAGEEGYAQILLEQQAVVRKGDVFVLRTISPVETIGGGRVVDPHVTRYHRSDEAMLSAVRTKDCGTPAEILEAFTLSYPFQTEAQLRELMNALSIADELEFLLASGKILLLEKTYLHNQTSQAIQQAVLQILKEYHSTNPLRAGMPKAELASRLNIGSACDPFLKKLEADGAIDIYAGIVAKADFTPSYSPQMEIIRKEIEEAIQAAGYTLLPLSDYTSDSAEKGQILEAMLQESLMLLEGQMVISRAMYQQAKDFAATLAKKHGVLKLSDFRDRLGTSRKYALLLLERFDKDKFTKRWGEERVVL